LRQASVAPFFPLLFFRFSRTSGFHDDLELVCEASRGFLAWLSIELPIFQALACCRVRWRLFSFLSFCLFFLLSCKRSVGFSSVSRPSPYDPFETGLVEVPPPFLFFLLLSFFNFTGGCVVWSFGVTVVKTKLAFFCSSPLL